MERNIKDKPSTDFLDKVWKKLVLTNVVLLWKILVNTVTFIFIKNCIVYISYLLIKKEHKVCYRPAKNNNKINVVIQRKESMS